MSLRELALKTSDIVKPFGETDVLLYYGVVAEKLVGFLKGKEIASKILIPSPTFPKILKRGSKLEPLYIEEMAEAVTPELFDLRKHHLKDVREKLTPVQQKVWDYFVPRKLVDFFYATNNEGAGNPIDRVFFDIDRGKAVSADDARRVTDLLANEIMAKDEGLAEVLGRTPEPFVMWTGSSFHIYLLLDKKQKPSFYNDHFLYTKADPEASFTGKWARMVREELRLNVKGGHEKMPDTIVIDPSQTPSGKLARAPFSLHMADARTVDGVAVPLERTALSRDDLVEELKAYTAAKVVRNLDMLAERLPR